MSSSKPSLASLNGYIEEMINGQKVVKVFCHEESAKERVRPAATTSCATTPPAPTALPTCWARSSNNMGHIQYVILAIIGGAMAIVGITNLSLSGGFGTLTLGAIAAFLTLSRSFMRAHQPGDASRSTSSSWPWPARSVSSACWMKHPRADEGYVTLVNAREDETASSWKATSAPAFGPGSIRISDGTRHLYPR